ncbi:MAG: proton-conducting transporter membrane subunit [Candidatus Margulisiibacteriota bacterium]
MNLLLSNIRLLFVFDPLALFFIIVILLVSFPALIYSIGYSKGKSTPLTLAFIASMLLLVSSANALYFLIFWELMSLLSYLLVLTDSENEQAVSAATLYIVMTHVGTAFLLAAFCFIYRASGSFDLSAMAAACQAMPQLQRDLLFICFLLGFGTKAGIVPLHIWLPYAHPQAPSHISSIMSGVMIKIAIYGFIRFVFCILGINSLWWGVLLLTLATITCLVGIIYALMENNLKKMLAYSSVENIGIILVAISLAMIFVDQKLFPLASLAMIAGLYHVVNHAVFKGLLFLCAGSVQKGAKTLNIEELGGLIKKMPWTALFFLIGAMGISALPPFNGFISEWLILQAFFRGAISVSGKMTLLLAVGAGALALTSGLAAACFVKVFGISFLALPRSEKAAEAKEVDWTMLISTGFLSVLVIALGLAAPFVIKMLAIIPASLFGTTPPIASLFNLYPPPNAVAMLSLLSIAMLLGIFLVMRKKSHPGATWDCGYYKIDSRNEYTATAFSKPFRITFGFFLLPFRRTELVKASSYHVSSFSHETRTTKIFKKYLYDAGLAVMMRFARSFRRMQAGSIHIYIAYIFVTLIFLILFLRII